MKLQVIWHNLHAHPNLYVFPKEMKRIGLFTNAGICLILPCTEHYVKKFKFYEKNILKKL